MITLQANRYPTAVSFTQTELVVTLNDGTKISNPLEWFPWLMNANDEQRQRYTLYGFSVEWEEFDDGVDIEGMLRGIKPRYPQKLSANG